MDFKFALRSLSKNPGFAIVAVLIMTLGIGANTAMFSVVNAVLLRPLAFRDPDRIVTVSTLWKKAGTSGWVSAPDFHDWHDQNNSFQAFAYYNNGETSVSTNTLTEFVPVAMVTREFFQVFGVEPVLGRLFSESETKPGGSAVLVSNSYWKSHLGGKPQALGSTLRMFNRTLTVIGVLPAGFHFPEDTDIWYAANSISSETTSRTAHNYLVVARLKPDVSLEAAQAQMTTIGDRLEKTYPENGGKGVAVARLSDSMVSQVRLTLYLMLGAVGMVLLIACANMANLLLAKATSRTREIAIRAAVGASRRRIIRQLIIESLVLAVVSGCTGLLVAIWGADALVAIAPSNIPRLAETGVDIWVLAFTFSVALAASVIFGVAPALSASRVDLNEALKQGATRAVVGGASARLRSALVVAEISLSMVLLAGAGLLIKSFASLQNVALGFRPENLLLARSTFPSSDLDGARQGTRFYRDMLQEARALPGVVAAGATMAPPGTVRSNGGYFIDQLPKQFGSVTRIPQAVFSVVTPGTLDALKIPIHTGRDFTDADDYTAPFTAIVNEALVRQSFGGKSPIGRTIFCGLDTPSSMTIVGVVGNVHQYGPAREPRPEIYMPYLQHPFYGRALTMVLRTSGPPAALSEALRRKIRERAPEVAVRFTTMEAALSANVATPRFRAVLLGIFAALAVALAMAGVYGVMAYSVGQRSNEIGLRMALGASAGDVARMVMLKALALAGIGVAAGLAGAAAATRLLTSMLFAVKPFDPVTYAIVSAAVILISLAASYIPARRAARLDPLVALRQE